MSGVVPPGEPRAIDSGSDTACVARAKRGDERAFESLYRRHVGRIHALCLRLAHDHAEADELTQDVFVRVWQRLATFRGESAFGTWLHRLAVNVVVSDRRSAWRRERRVADQDPADDAAPTAALDRSASPGVRLDLEQAMARLPAGARTVFVLHDVEGYEHKEIAEIVGIAEGTSKAQLFRARRLLREALEK
jgi:RNA polymerase sigma-70 factor (ECF subfamily)